MAEREEILVERLKGIQHLYGLLAQAVDELDDANKMMIDGTLILSVRYGPGALTSGYYPVHPCNSDCQHQHDHQYDKRPAHWIVRYDLIPQGGWTIGKARKATSMILKSHREQYWEDK